MEIVGFVNSMELLFEHFCSGIREEWNDATTPIRRWWEAGSNISHFDRNSGCSHAFSSGSYCDLICLPQLPPNVGGNWRACLSGPELLDFLEMTKRCWSRLGFLDSMVQKQRRESLFRRVASPGEPLGAVSAWAHQLFIPECTSTYYQQH